MALKKEEQELHDKAVAEWLAKGNKITICEPFQRSDPLTQNLIDGREDLRKRLTKASSVLY